MKACAFSFDGIELCASPDDDQTRSDVALIRNQETSTLQNFRHIHTHMFSHPLIYVDTCMCTQTPGQFLSRSFPDRGAFLRSLREHVIHCGSASVHPQGADLRSLGEVGTRENKAFSDVFLWRQQSEVPWPQLTKVNYSLFCKCVLLSPEYFS